MITNKDSFLGKKSQLRKKLNLPIKNSNLELKYQSFSPKSEMKSFDEDNPRTRFSSVKSEEGSPFYCRFFKKYTGKFTPKKLDKFSYNGFLSSIGDYQELQATTNRKNRITSYKPQSRRFGRLNAGITIQNWTFDCLESNNNRRKIESFLKRPN